MAYVITFDIWEVRNMSYNVTSLTLWAAAAVQKNLNICDYDIAIIMLYNKVPMWKRQLKHEFAI